MNTEAWNNETWEQRAARLSANRERYISEATTPEERRQRIETHIAALTIDATIAFWNNQAAKALGIIPGGNA